MLRHIRFPQRLFVGLIGLNPNPDFEVVCEDLPVADLSGLSYLLDAFHNSFFQVVGARDFHLNLGHKVHDVFSPVIKPCVTFRASESLHFDNGHYEFNELPPNGDLGRRAECATILHTYANSAAICREVI